MIFFYDTRCFFVLTCVHSNSLYTYLYIYKLFMFVRLYDAGFSYAGFLNLYYSHSFTHVFCSHPFPVGILMEMVSPCGMSEMGMEM